MLFSYVKMFKPWEYAAIALSTLVFALMSYFLITNFSLRPILWPSSDESRLASPIGRISSSSGTTLKQGYQQSEFVPLSRNDRVYPLDTLMSGPNSTLKIILNDHSVISLGENSMIRLSFDTALQLSGLNRQTVVEIFKGSVAAKNEAKVALKLRSQGKTLSAAPGKALLVSANGHSEIIPTGSHVIPAKERLADAAARFKKIGAVMVPNKEAPKHSVADIYKTMQQKSGEMAAPKTLTKVLPSLKQVKASFPQLWLEPSSEIRFPQNKASEVEPNDNESVKIGSEVAFRWKSAPEDATCRLRISHAGDTDQVIELRADGGTAEIKRAFKKPGTYVWHIEDSKGAVITVRNLHVGLPFRAIPLSDPLLILPDDDEGKWLQGQQGKALLFEWRAVQGVKNYRIAIARNLKGSGSELVEKTVNDTKIALPFGKNWEPEQMFLTVTAFGPKNIALQSNTLPFTFTFLPPSPATPANNQTLPSSALIEGAVPLGWKTLTDVSGFTVEIAKDPRFKRVVDTEQIDDNSYRFFPSGSGTYYWRVKSQKEDLSSPYSPTMKFIVQ